MIVLKLNSKNDYVKAVQYILEIATDGIYGRKTKEAVRKYQKSKGLAADGIVGEDTYSAFVLDAPTLKVGATGKWVNALECILQTLTKDGTFAVNEKAHVKTFQTAMRLNADGIVGQKTWLALFGMDQLSWNGAAITKPAESKSIVTATQPKNFKQYDSKWKNVVFTKNNNYDMTQTIGNSGCGPTAMADIVAAWWDSSVTPVDMAALCVNAGYRTTNNGTAWGYFRYVAKKYKASQFIQTSSYTTAEAAIKNGACVICAVGPGIWTKNGHLICWWKVDDNYVYICDPGGSSAARAKSNKSNLRAQATQYFIFYK